MKQIYLSTTILFLAFINLNAQTPTTVITLNPYSVFDFAVNGNDLYYSDYDLGGIYKIDVTTTSPTPTLVASGLSAPYGLYLDGNDLYFAENTDNKIFKLDITSNLPITPTNFITGLAQGPMDIVVNGNDLYYLTENNSTNGKLFKTDKTNPVSSTELVSGLGVPFGLQISGNFIYYSEIIGNRSIYKLDITQSGVTPVTVSSNINQPAYFVINGNDMYIPVRSDNKIVKLDITSTLPTTTTDLVTTGQFPSTVAIIGGEMFIGEYSEGRITKVSLATLSNDEFSLSQDMKLYPNPSNSFIQISGLMKTENYRISNSLGQEVKEGIVFKDEKIDITNLNNGPYLLKLENGSTLKFVKE